MPRTNCGAAHQGPPRDAQLPAKVTDRRSRATVPDELAARRELRSWARAAEHLNRAGYGAAVPAALVRPLRRRGLLVWPARGCAA